MVLNFSLSCILESVPKLLTSATEFQLITETIVHPLYNFAETKSPSFKIIFYVMGMRLKIQYILSIVFMSAVILVSQTNLVRDVCIQCRCLSYWLFARYTENNMTILAKSFSEKKSDKLVVPLVDSEHPLPVSYASFNF